jgi:uncharacterized protein YcfL
MKKTIFAIAMVMALISCGGSEESTVVSDSTFIVDSVLVQDTAVVVEPTVEPAVEEAGGIQDGTEVK